MLGGQDSYVLKQIGGCSETLTSSYGIKAP